MKSFEDLTQPDGRLSLFAPGRNTQESLAALQEAIAPARMGPDVPDDVRAYFDTVCDLFVYGWFVYEFFAVAADYALLGCEFALGIRFLSVYGGAIPLKNDHFGETAVIQADDYQAVRDALGRNGSHAHGKGWELEGHKRFNGSLASLLDWAKSEGLFTAWLDRRWEELAPGFRLRPDELPPAWVDWDEASRQRWLQEVYRREWERRTLDTTRELRNMRAHARFRLVSTPSDAATSIRHRSSLMRSLWS